MVACLGQNMSPLQLDGPFWNNLWLCDTISFPNIKGIPCLLLHDGHTTRISIDLMGKSSTRTYLIVCAATTHQSSTTTSLSVDIFSPFKHSLSAEIHKLCHSRVGLYVVRKDSPFCMPHHENDYFKFPFTVFISLWYRFLKKRRINPSNWYVLIYIRLWM